METREPYEGQEGVYDILHGHRDFAGEAKEVADYLIPRIRSGGRRLLDVACGTGLHAQHLSEQFEVQGVDASEAQVKAARARLGEKAVHLGDMAKYQVGETFDAVICLLSSIRYMTTFDRLQQAVDNMVGHLRPGGVLLVSPWMDPDKFDGSQPRIKCAEGGDVVATRISSFRREGRLVTTTTLIGVGRPNGVESYVEEHLAMLTTLEELTDVLISAGVGEIAWVPGFTHGFLVGNKPL